MDESKVGRKVVKTASNILNIAIIALSCIIAAYCCYSMWDSSQVYKSAKASSYEIYKPTPETGEAAFKKLQEINPDIFAWLTVYGTNIDYPVAQSSNNVKYINTSIIGDYSVSGGIFLDWGNSQDFSDFVNILYGHNMEKNVLFGEIGLFVNKNYFDARKYGTLHWNGQEKGLEFFAFLHTDSYDYPTFQTKITGQGNRQNYLNMLLKKVNSTLEEGKVTADDKLVLLTTCSAVSTNGRDVLIGKITDEIHENPFKTAKSEARPIIDELMNLWKLWLNAPLLTKLITILLQILPLISIIYRKKHRSNSEVN